MRCSVGGCARENPDGPVCRNHLERIRLTGVAGSALTCTYLGCPEAVAAVVRQRYLRKAWLGCTGHYEAMAKALAIGQRVDDPGVTVAMIGAAA